MVFWKGGPFFLEDPSNSKRGLWFLRVPILPLCCCERRPILPIKKSCSLCTDQCQVLNSSLGQWPLIWASFVNRLKSRYSDDHPLNAGGQKDTTQWMLSVHLYCLDNFACSKEMGSNRLFFLNALWRLARLG